jgi:mannose-6-phosphate isomerase-like protein (cupin superfamily)
MSREVWDMKIWQVKDDKYNHEKVWGNECWLVNNEEYCGKLLYLKKNHKCSNHYHKLKHETFVITTGLVLMEYGDGDDYVVLKEYDAIEIPRGTPHSFTGITDAMILEVSTQHHEEDSFRNNKSKKLGYRERKHLKKLVKGKI